MLVVFLVIYKDLVLKLLLRLTRGAGPLHRLIRQEFNDVIEGKFVVFVHNFHRLHTILSYIDRNETGWDVTMILCKDPGLNNHKRWRDLKQILHTLQTAGVFTHFTVRAVYKNKIFGPQVVDEVSRELGVSKNRILLGSIHRFHPFGYDDLGGARIIF